MMKKFCPQNVTPNRCAISPNFGFTLIELLVVITIIGILFTIGIASYNNFNRKQILEQAAKTLKNDLRLVQSKASSGEKDCSPSVCGGTTDGCGNDNDGTEKTLDKWQMNFVSYRYAFYGSCGGTPFGTTYIDLPAGVTFEPVPSSITFSTLSRGISIDVTMTLKSGSGTETVTITKSGEIN